MKKLLLIGILAIPIAMLVQNFHYNLSVQFGDFVYTGRYDVKRYRPDDLIVNDPMRFGSIRTQCTCGAKTSQTRN